MKLTPWRRMARIIHSRPLPRTYPVHRGALRHPDEASGRPCWPVAGPLAVLHGARNLLPPETAIDGGLMGLSRPPPLRNLRAFCVAARQRSFKFAAAPLCLTPSAVSHQMRELETLLGMRLFERKTRALELTTAGHRLLEGGEPALGAPGRGVLPL